MNNIYLVGFMGTGKTAVGKKTAALMKRRFLDLDGLIEVRQNKSIPEIFSLKGEAYFRKIEKEILAETAKESNLVVSCGGGIVIDKDNMALMKNTGVVVCLSASVEMILKRTSRFSHRPLINVDNPRERIESLLKARAPFYAQADFTIDTSELTVSGVAEQILCLTAK